MSDKPCSRENGFRVECIKHYADIEVELARIKGRVIALEAQLESEKAAMKALRASSFVTAVPSEDYERMKEQYQSIIDQHLAENARLKAEVERLTELDENAKATIADRNEYIRELLFNQPSKNELKAEIERLRKAGDELSNALSAFHQIYRGRIDTTTQPDIAAWNAAKEGKPSV